MKISKKAMSLCAVLVGAAVFTTAAAADVMLGSGYTGAKDALKSTMAYLSSEADSFTVDGEFAVTVDGKTFTRSVFSGKSDNRLGMQETHETSTEPDGETYSRYTYEDGERWVTQDEDDDLYYVHKINREDGEDGDPLFTNPFEEEQVQDLEKVVDAFAGTMKDVVQAEETDGGRIYSGTMCDAQVPAVVNALTAFVAKYSLISDYRWEEAKFPAIANDIFLQEASGKAVANGDGILETVMVKVTLSGKTEDGVSHTISAELSVTLSDVNSTTVTAPVLTDENSQVATGYGNPFDERYVGTYKNDIVTEENGKFVKIGERVLTITSCENGKVTGSYAEIYKPGYEQEAKSFDFATGDEAKYGDITFNYTLDGETRHGMMLITGDCNQNLRMTPNVTFLSDGGYSSHYEEGFDGEFIRCLD